MKTIALVQIIDIDKENIKNLVSKDFLYDPDNRVVSFTDVLTR